MKSTLIALVIATVTLLGTGFALASVCGGNACKTCCGDQCAECCKTAENCAKCCK